MGTKQSEKNGNQLGRLCSRTYGQFVNVVFEGFARFDSSIRPSSCYSISRYDYVDSSVPVVETICDRTTGI